MNKAARTICVFASLSVLAVAAQAATYAELLAKAKIAHQHAAKSGKTLTAAEAPKAPYAATAADRKRGYVLYQPPLHEPLQDRAPAAGEVRGAVTVRAAQGEIESCLVGVHALADQKGLAWSMQGPMPAGLRIEVLPVVLAPLAERRSDKYRVVGLWLADGGAVDVPAGHSRGWLLRVHVAPETKPGEYTVVRSLTRQGAAAGTKLTLRVRVLPLRLADPWKQNYVFGAFCAGADFSEAQYRGMKAHGLDAILWFWGHYGLDVRNESGKLRMDFQALDGTVARFRKAGLRGPIVLALGNDCCGHFERAICQAFKLPMQPQARRRRKTVKLAVLDNPEIERLMVEALRQLFDHAKKNDWPEIVILPYDEPTERLMNEHKRMVRLFRTRFPKVRLYGVTMNRLKWAEMVLDTDILVSNGDFSRILALARKHKKSSWLYGSATTAQGYARCRWRFGLRTYSYKPDGMWFWCYNFYVGDPWNEFDGFTPDSSWVICWPPLEKGAGSVETLAYEGLREAVDDVRYALTLENTLQRVDSAEAAKVGGEYRKWLQGLQGADPRAEQAVAYRQKIVKWLLAVQPR